MFSEVWSAVKRLFDLTVVPVLIALFCYLAEVAMGAVTWIVVIVGDFVIKLIGGLLSLVPMPAGGITDSTFGAKFLDLAQVAGLWPAVLVYFSFAVMALIARVASFGIVGNR